MTTTTVEPTTKPRGLACCSPERRREIASMGGRARVAKGVGHYWTQEEAQAAGKIAGMVHRRKARERRLP